MTFKVQSELRGEQSVSAAVYFWRGGDDLKLVISDIDGTITKSDVFGHIMPMLGKDWSHSSVAKLYSSIVRNGYKIIYLTSRAIGQAQLTRNYLLNLTQEGGTMLPPGPVLMSPDRLFTALNREVILRKPEEFKIACLKDVARVFSVGADPFYAGFGNRDTDVVSYLAVGVPVGKIFIINPKGEIKTSNKTYKKSYSSMHEIVEVMFPASKSDRVCAKYNASSFWRLPLPEIDPKDLV
jgi:phosphatidate phosphatase LPIN